MESIKFFVFGAVLRDVINTLNTENVSTSQPCRPNELKQEECHFISFSPKILSTKQVQPASRGSQCEDADLCRMQARRPSTQTLSCPSCLFLKHKCKYYSSSNENDTQQGVVQDGYDQKCKNGSKDNKFVALLSSKTYGQTILVIKTKHALLPSAIHANIYICM